MVKYICLKVCCRCVDPRLAQKLPDRFRLNFHKICKLGQIDALFHLFRFGEKSQYFPKVVSYCLSLESRAVSSILRYNLEIGVRGAHTTLQ